MATTSTNKQPLLVDRPFHNHIPADRLNSGSEGVDILGANSAKVLVDCTTNDGGVIEEAYSISRGLDSNGEQFNINFYISSSTDFLRPDEAVYIGTLQASDTVGQTTAVENFPRVLAPLPNDGGQAQVKAFYVPRGRAIWFTLQLVNPDLGKNAPIVAAQGGFY